MNNLMFELATNILEKKKHHNIASNLLDIINLKIEENSLQGNWHPLGFIHIKIGTVKNIGDLRLHIWSDIERRSQKPEMPIHNHIFTVNSHIITGEISNKNFILTKGSKYRIYNISYGGSSSILTATDNIVDCKLKSESTYKVGDFYQVNKEDFHESLVAEDEFVTTIVLATDTDKNNDPPITLGPFDGNIEYVYHRMPCENEILEGLINRLRLKLKDASVPEEISKK